MNHRYNYPNVPFNERSFTTLPNAASTSSSSRQKSKDEVAIERLCEAIMFNNKHEVTKQLNGLDSSTEIDSPLHNIIHVASKNADSYFLTELLKNSVFSDHVNDVDGLGYSPLMYAVYAGRTENIKILLDKGAVIFAKRSTPDSIRNEGSENTHTSIENSTNRNHKSGLLRHLNRTAIHIAAERGNNNILELLLSHCDVSDREEAINQADDKGWTPLFWAAQSGHYTCFKTLLQNGGNIKETDKEKRNVFHIIAGNDRSNILNELINEPNYEHLLTGIDSRGHTPFMTASAKGFVETAKSLLPNEKELREDHNQNTVLHLAAERGNKEVLEFLLRNHLSQLRDVLENSKVFLQDDIHIGRSWIDTAILKEIVPKSHHINGNEETLEQKFDVWFPDIIKKPNKDGCNCFHLAAGSGNIRCLHILYACCITLREGFAFFDSDNFNTKNNFGATPLHYAISSKSHDVIKFLITHGADLMSRTKLLPILSNTWDTLRANKVPENGGETTDEVDRVNHEPVAINTEENEEINTCFGTMPTALSYILKTAKGADILKEIFDECVGYEQVKEDSFDLVVDFRLLISRSGLRMAMANEIYRHDFKKLPDVLLLHPLLKAFIEREWRERKFFPWFRFLTYSIFLLFVTTFAWLPTHSHWPSRTLSWLVGILSMLILILCLPYVLPGQNFYDRILGILQRIPPPILALAAVLVDSSSPLSLPLQGLAVTFSWLSLIFYFTTLSSLNHQAAQFQTVLFTMLRNVGVFFVVIFGFAFSFYILYFKEENFTNAGKAFLYTTVILLQGGMENSPQFSRNSTGVNTEMMVTESAISFLFMIVAAVALLNMLIGLAVSGASELRNEGQLVFMRHQVKLLLELDQLEEFCSGLNCTFKNMGCNYRSTSKEKERESQDARMEVNSDNFSLGVQIELHDIAKPRLVNDDSSFRKPILTDEQRQLQELSRSWPGGRLTDVQNPPFGTNVGPLLEVQSTAEYSQSLPNWPGNMN